MAENETEKGRVMRNSIGNIKMVGQPTPSNMHIIIIMQHLLNFVKSWTYTKLVEENLWHGLTTKWFLVTIGGSGGI